MISRMVLLAVCFAVTGLAALPDGLYAVIQTSKGKIVARLLPELAPLTVANYVGLVEGTITNAAFDPGRPFYDGAVFHRVVPGHVIQTGVPKSERAKGPGYSIPNEINAKLSHNHAGVLNMANAGPNTSGAQWCITLGDRSYLDGNFNIFGEVVEGLDVVMKVVQGDLLESVRIERVGAAAQAYRVSHEGFQATLSAAKARVVEFESSKKAAETEWIGGHYQNVAGTVRVRYRGTQLRYVGDVLGHVGPAMEEVRFASGETGLPGFFDEPRTFVYEVGKTKVGPNGIVDAVIAAMKVGERKVVVIPTAQGYGRAGFYPPEVPGQKRFVISPFVALVYEVEVVAGN